MSVTRGKKAQSTPIPTLRGPTILCGPLGGFGASIPLSPRQRRLLVVLRRQSRSRLLALPSNGVSLGGALRKDLDPSTVLWSMSWSKPREQGRKTTMGSSERRRRKVKTTQILSAGRAPASGLRLRRGLNTKAGVGFPVTVFFFLSPSTLCLSMGKCKKHQVQSVERFSQFQCHLEIEVILHKIFVRFKEDWASKSALEALKFLSSVSALEISSILLPLVPLHP